MSTILCVGRLDVWEDVLRAAETRGEAHFVPFAEVTRRLITDMAPATVVSPLLADDFDATDLAAALQQAGFSGRYIAVAIGIPVPHLIENEVRVAAPAVSFDLVLLGGSSRLN